MIIEAEARRECSRLDLILKSCRTFDKPVNAKKLANNMHAKVPIHTFTYNGFSFHDSLQVTTSYLFNAI